MKWGKLEVLILSRVFVSGRFYIKRCFSIKRVCSHLEGVFGLRGEGGGSIEGRGGGGVVPAGQGARNTSNCSIFPCTRSTTTPGFSS